MLALSRKVNQEIHVGPNIVVRVLRVSGETVRLGIAAPKSLQIRRPDAIDKSPTVEFEHDFAI